MSKLADRIEKWRSQEGGKEDELYIELLVEAEEKLRELEARLARPHPTSDPETNDD